jgi:hypothetical protein
MSTTRPVHPHLVDQPGIRFGLANALLVVGFFAATLAGLGIDDTEFLAVVLAGLAGVGLSLLMAASLGAIAWAMFTGFVENDYGQLTLTRDDLVRLGVFTVCSVALAAFLQRCYLVIKENAHE